MKLNFCVCVFSLATATASIYINFIFKFISGDNCLIEFWFWFLFLQNEFYKKKIIESVNEV